MTLPLHQQHTLTSAVGVISLLFIFQEFVNSYPALKAIYSKVKELPESQGEI